MNLIGIYTLKACRKIYASIFADNSISSKNDVIRTPQEASDLIFKLLISSKPCMIARYGGNELNVVVNYLSIQAHNHSVYDYVRGKSYDWWWNKKGLSLFSNNAGFFPLNEDCLCRFGKLMVDDSQQIDILGSWLRNESILIKKFHNIRKVSLLCLEPYWATKPWTRALKGKKVLVIHPFARLIEKQYHEHRTQLFKNPDILPEFELQTLQAVQSIGGNGGQYNTWFDALLSMEEEIDKRDYDIALIGCGAYGFPLAAYVKRSGKQAVHLGGALQLLFGIKGKRWEVQNYGTWEFCNSGDYLNLFNEYWCRPGDEMRPANAEKVEGACYW